MSINVTAAGEDFQANQGPLTGIRVLDLTDASGQYCGRVFAELGADVLKVEPLGGDAARQYGPFYKGCRHPEKSLFWLHFNANKRSITLNINTEKGREVARKLAVRADIVVETFSPGVLDEVGLGWKVLNQLHAGIILTSITPFGQTGPWSKRKSSDLVALALGGLLYQCGWPDKPPVRLGGFQAYHMASLNAATGTMVALYQRMLTGKGQHVDVSMQECIPIALMTTIPEYIATGQIRARTGDEHFMAATGVFPCQDGYVDIRLRNQHWEELIDWLASHNAAEDLVAEKWKNPWNRVSPNAVEHIDSIFRSFLMKFNKSDIYYESLKRGFEVGPVNSAADIAKDKQLLDRHFFEEVEIPEFAAKLQLPRGPYRLSQTPTSKRKRAPRIGEHNEEIYLKELGMAEEEYRQLKKMNVI